MAEVRDAAWYTRHRVPLASDGVVILGAQGTTGRSPGEIRHSNRASRHRSGVDDDDAAGRADCLAEDALTGRRRTAAIRNCAII